MSKYTFGTKAETLAFLYEHTDKLHAEVLKPLFFTVKEWQEDGDRVLSRVLDSLGEVPRLIVRSSAKSEDSAEESLAGKFESVICNRN